jgi:hypothetical protein
MARCRCVGSLWRMLIWRRLRLNLIIIIATILILILIKCNRADNKEQINLIIMSLVLTSMLLIIINLSIRYRKEIQQ